MNRCMCPYQQQHQMMNPCYQPPRYPQPRYMEQNSPRGYRTDNSRPMSCKMKQEPCKEERKEERCQKKDSCCMEKKEPSCSCKEKPRLSRSQMLQYINEVSFAVNDISLYLDTHPCDQEAMEYYQKHVAMRKEALRDYAKHYGPLTIDTANDADSDSWEWVMQPWPWEGGSC